MVEKIFKKKEKIFTKPTTRQLTILYNDNESMAEMTNITKEFTQINKI